MKAPGLVTLFPAESVILCPPGSPQEHGLHQCVLVNFARSRRPTAEAAGEPKRPGRHFSPRAPPLEALSPPWAHLTFGLLQILSARGPTDVVSDERLCWARKTTEHQGTSHHHDSLCFSGRRHLVLKSRRGPYLSLPAVPIQVLCMARTPCCSAQD